MRITINEFEFQPADCLAEWSLKSLRSFRKKSGIYLFLNTAKMLGYVGYSHNMAGRWVYHRRALIGGVHINPKLQSAWIKYGEDTFQIYVCNYYNREELPDREIEWVAKCNSYYNGYNLTRGGDSASEMMERLWESQDFREKHAVKLKKLWADPDYREKQKQRASTNIKELYANGTLLTPEQIEIRRESGKKVMNMFWKDEGFRTIFKQKHEKAKQIRKDRIFEQITIIRMYKDLGYDYTKIARKLNELNYPTISGRGKWRWNAVNRICKEIDSQIISS